MKTSVELSQETLDEIVCKSLKDTLDILKEDMVRVKEGKHISIFSTDNEEDIKMIKKHIKAIKLLLSWYDWPSGMYN